MIRMRGCLASARDFRHLLVDDAEIPHRRIEREVEAELGGFARRLPAFFHGR
jgi:hypothetical protein